MKYRFLKAILTGLVLLGATGASAGLIKKTVTVGDYEWAQVSLFNDLSWATINAVCPDGVCGGGDLNGFEMTGWTWASAAFVGYQLLAPYSDHPGGEAYLDTTEAVGDALFSTLGFEMGATSIGRRLQGWTSNYDVSFGYYVGYVFMTDYKYLFNVPGATFATQYYDQLDGGQQPNEGAFMYRVKVVPEPSTLAILALGLIGLASRLFKKQS